MSKKECVYRCAYCGRFIEYGDVDAVVFDDELFCDNDCVMDSLDIESCDWGYRPNFVIDKCKANGFGVRYIADSWFSNGNYVIFDKFDGSKFEFDDGYDDYFNVKRNKGLPDVSRYLETFDKRKHLFVSIRDGDCCTYERKRPLNSIEYDLFNKVLGIYVNSYYWRFVLDYIAGGVTPEIFNALVEDDVLYIECNGNKALILSSREPMDSPELFEEQTIALPARRFDDGMV